MKYTFLLFCLLFSISSVFSQELLNGDFEKTLVKDCSYNLTNSAFNDSMQYVYSFGVNEQPDIQTHDCYVVPQNGDWCVGLSSKPSGGHDAIALELSAPLTTTGSYELRFWTYGNTTFHILSDSLRIGLSSSPDAFGKVLYSVLPAQSEWQEHIIAFQAPIEGSYISVEMKEELRSGWVQVDHFTLTKMTTGINDPGIGSDLRLYPNPGNDLLNIKLAGQFSDLDLSITAMDGRLVHHQIFQNIQDLQLDVSGLASGFYLVQINSADEQVTLKWIKQ